ncbi:hypothetical protein [Novosphingobium album (ex Hu et al. 2023)]|uniref:Anti-sigma factor n=1 Tax=Novosphingobium album (ex Hu et al. 2023) TaxID=2930093 RepID=A0ABT0B018_9SPHN|nr:hypothetical protein [Novosphingobium album (ex Hu et al. 2023)]MCJ2178417.1 hypothetical protein [Novosphingobium album (ex Hu et al. 2023)]
MNPQNAGVIADEERARIAALLIRYPDNTPEELAELTNWFDRVATPLDLGMLASNPDAAKQYRAYRAQHIDRFKFKDMTRAALFIGTVSAVIAGIGLLMP